jgi:hypothetical protein
MHGHLFIQGTSIVIDFTRLLAFDGGILHFAAL